MTQGNNNTEKIMDLGAIREDPELEMMLDKISKIPSLVRPPILFPDLAYKPDTEAPASLVIATRGTIIPTLTAPSLGCSMGVITTTLRKKDITLEWLRKFYANMQDELGQHYSILENILVWIGIKKRKLKKYDLATSEFEDIIREGAPSAIKRYNIPKETVRVFDNDGSMFAPEERATLHLHDILPRSSFTNGRHDLGYGFKGNHFLEVQYVEKIHDQKIADNLGLSEEQVVIMYHGGGGMVPYHVGRYYSSRRKNTWKQKMFQIVGKIFFHFFSVQGLLHARERFLYYFTSKPFREIPLNTSEGQRLLNATKASLNYSYAFNVAIYRRVIDALTKNSQGKTTNPKLVVAKIHNALVEEVADGKPAMVHRHTVTRVESGEPTIISGFNNTNSYIGVGGKALPQYLNSADHGSGKVHKHLKDKLQKLPYSTTIFRTKEPKETSVEHVSNDGIEQVMDLLEKRDIIKRGIELRPIASFKG